MPPWTCTPREATSTPTSVDQALAMGVSSSSRRRAASRSACGRRRRGQVGGDGGEQADGPRGLDLGLHVRQHPAHVRVVEDRRAGLAGPGRAALAALQGEGQRLLVGPLGDADALHADVQPRGVHHGEHVRQALVRLARPARPWRPRTASRRWARRGCPACARCSPGRRSFGCAQRAVLADRRLGARNSEMPRLPAGASGRRASTRWTMFSAQSWSPQVMKIFWPCRR